MSAAEENFLTAVHVWAATAWADGVVTDEEAMVMKAIISVAKLTDAEKETATGWLENKVELDDVADIAGIPVDNRAHIYSAALGVVAIDKDVADSEKVFLSRLQTALELDDETAAKLHKEAGIK